uniref:Uncharacterized protein n=1 Tax=Ananas comosus var. bracteatus TaxID=296719 RepID=A0A6V7PLR0_ANACO|nr:unnamed protein product [Ananas comosus var. bracteatus]
MYLRISAYSPFLSQDPLTDVADIGVSSFSEACTTHHEDEGAKEDDDSIVEKSKNEAITKSPSLGKRERVVDISTIEAHKRARLETNLNSTESKSNNDPEDALSPYGDEVDYEPTPSPPEPFENNDMDVPLDENVGIHLDSGTGDSQSEIPIVAKSFLIDRIMDTMKTFNHRKFRSAREEVSKYCQCLSSLGIDISELERHIKPIFDHAEFNDMAVKLDLDAQFNDVAVKLDLDAQFNDMAVKLHLDAQFNDMAVKLHLDAQFNDMAVKLHLDAQFNDMAVNWKIDMILATL